MVALNNRKSSLITYVLPLLVVLLSVVLAVSPLLQKYPELATAITYDLTFLAPVLFLLLSKKSNVSKIKAVPFFIGGTIIASYLLPESGQEHLNYIKNYALPIVELTVLSFIIRKIYLGVKAFKSNAVNTSDVLVIIKKSAHELLGESRFASFFASEITMMYYAFFSWKRQKRSVNEFTNYKENASITLAAALLLIVFIETYAFHIFLMKWSSVAAWILTLTSIYTAFMIIAHIKALLRRPAVLTEEKLFLKNGLIADITIHLVDIKTVESYVKDMESAELTVGNLGLSKDSTTHNIAIHFKRPQQIEKMYGFKETCDVLLIHMDDKNKFLNRLQERLEQLSV